MHRRWFASASFGVAIAAALTLTPSMARADVVVPSGFDVVREYALNRCEPFALTDPSDFTVTVWVSACVSGSLDFGLNTNTGLYGAAYDFTTTITGTPPGGWVVAAEMCDFGFDGYWPDTGSHTFATVGMYACLGGTPITSGVAYSPIWFSGSQLVETSASFAAFIPFPSVFTSDDRFGSVAVTTVPEPPTAVLVGAGLLLLLGASGASRRGPLTIGPLVMRRGHSVAHSGDR